MAKEKTVKGKKSKVLEKPRVGGREQYQERSSDQLCQMPSIRVNKLGSETGSLDLAIWRTLMTLTKFDGVIE